MEETQSTQQPVVSGQKGSKPMIMIVVVGVVALLLGLLLGGLIGSRTKAPEVTTTTSTNTNTPTIPPVKTTDPRQLLDPIELLKSPVFTEWKGSVEGEVVAKDAESFTIEKNGRQLKVFTQQSLTGFYRETANAQELPVQIQFSDLKVGDMVSGGVTITRGTLTNDRDQHVFADVFTVLNENPNSQ